MSATLITLLTLVQALLTSSGSAGIVAKVVSSLVSIVPVLAQEAPLALQSVKNIIALVSGNPDATQEQLDSLAALDAQCDAAFDAAVDAFQKANPSA